jgi:ABC-type Fe3+-hydroxamate transport system substrate-binding protein
MDITKTFIDQLGREIQIPFPPKRIISLVPSQTELLFYLGLDEEIVGITKFCIHPAEKVKSKTKIGGTKKLNIEKIRQLNPDIIIGNKEENEEQQVKELMREFTVWMSDIKTLNDAFDMIERIGQVVNKKDAAEKLIAEIQIQFGRLKENLKLLKNRLPLKTLYLIWRNPYMTVGADTFINSMMELCGFENCLKNKLRYPEIPEQDIKAANPQLILLSSEPYPFKEKHIEELKNICPKAKIRLADGELFSWYGSRLLKSPAYFEQLLEEILDSS